ncbi:MAG: hypothetical protein Fur0037_03050 [Planctomycetota bacterium]
MKPQSRSLGRSPSRKQKRLPLDICMAAILCSRWLQAHSTGRELVITFAWLLACCLLFRAAEHARPKIFRAVGEVVLVLLATTAMPAAAGLAWHEPPDPHAPAAIAGEDPFFEGLLALLGAPW